MRLMILTGAAVALSTLTACASDYDSYASACQREYARNRDRATAAGAVIGGAAGAAIDDSNDARGAAIGAAVGGIVGSQMARDDDPCRYTRERYAYSDPYYGRTGGYYDQYGRWHRY